MRINSTRSHRHRVNSEPFVGIMYEIRQNESYTRVVCITMLLLMIMVVRTFREYGTISVPNTAAQQHSSSGCSVWPPVARSNVVQKMFDFENRAC